MTNLALFVKVAQSNLRKIEREIEQKKYAEAIRALQDLKHTLTQTEQTVDFCPSLQTLKERTHNLMNETETKMKIH